MPALKATNIYGLIDPRTNELRYVGKTVKSINARRCDHAAAAKAAGHKRPVNAWLAGLFSSGFRPAIFLVERVPASEDWEAAEQFWIAYFRSIGCRLTNLSEGGGGPNGLRLTPEQKATRRWLRGAEHPRFGKKDPPERIEANRALAKERWSDAKWAEAQKAKMAAGTRTPEARAAAGERFKRLFSDQDFKEALDAKRADAMRRPDVRQKTGAASKRIWAENREAIIAAQNAGKGDAWREKQSASKTAQWRDPDYRKRTSEAHAKALTAEDVLEIKALIASGARTGEIARKYGVRSDLISHIKSGRIWKHI